MEQVVPWARLVERLRPFYPKSERGRPPIGLDRVLRLYFLQQWYGLADGDRGGYGRGAAEGRVFFAAGGAASLPTSVGAVQPRPAAAGLWVMAPGGAPR
jgi:hypothetical protein